MMMRQCVLCIVNFNDRKTQLVPFNYIVGSCAIYLKLGMDVLDEKSSFLILGLSFYLK